MEPFFTFLTFYQVIKHLWHQARMQNSSIFTNEKYKVISQLELKWAICVGMAPSSFSESTSEGGVASGTVQTECAVDHPLKPNEG